MASRTCSPALLAVIDAVTQRNHFPGCSLRNVRAGSRGSARIRIRALGWFCRGFGNFPGRRCRTRAGSEGRATACRATLIDDFVDPSAYVVGNIKRAVRPDGHARRTMGSFVRRLHRSRESVGKYLALTGCMVAGERLKDDVVTALRIGRTIPRTVEGNKHAAAVSGGELLLVIKRHSVRPPMSGKCRHRRNLVRACANLLAAIPTVSRRQNQLLRKWIVVTLRPAVVSSRLQ